MDIINDNLRISTMTQIARIQCPINLQDIYDRLNISENITYIEYADTIPKGEKQKKVNKRKKNDTTKKRKFFYNQATIHVVQDKIVNVKIFNNGGIQMTGLKSKNQGSQVLEKIVSELKKYELVPLDVCVKPIKIVSAN